MADSMIQREFHVARQARDRYQFDDALFVLDGNVVFANLHAARRFAFRINQTRDLARFPEQAVRAGQINALGLIDELLHYLFLLYRQQVAPTLLSDALAALTASLGAAPLESAMLRFVDEFPTVGVYRNRMEAQTYLKGETDGVPNREIVLEEMLMLWLTNANPAAVAFQELFDDTRLQKETAYPKGIVDLREFFNTQPRFGPDHQTLIELLRAPALASPHSLTGQLEYILERWRPLLGQDMLSRLTYRMLGALDMIKEEEKIVWGGGPGGAGGWGGPGPSLVPMYELAQREAEPERFTPDREWMPNLVMIAKNSYVWLDQLSKKYRRAVTRLDEIPDEELDTLRRSGITGLWFIGLWERSQASQRIKQMTGNPNAVSSAYSVYDYRIAADLGGEAAYQNLRDRAWQRGVRLASDMVPNHMGIDSRWVMEHPDWFVSLDASPFPVYSFNGPDLSPDPSVGIYLEDHYFNRSDAAVVFKRVDHRTGQVRYIYHGNDGTSFPWNDTAQLDYLNAAVREGVIQTILAVARRFPIIRFDAAMTLAKKHFQRLWFPEPGTGGAIPSRAEHGLTRAQFDAFMPEEFWREVVDRVAVEAPDTLLLAEAFWLLEGYFVRTLGMHRVYNSAFMNMLRDEENAKYRSVIKNTVEFDSEILKRYVNFMNNPDERTAVDQFGKSDKYFGVCTIMVTMPGLPMLGHGQIEGFTERYGMDFRHALWDEQSDDALVKRHEREIFPLLHKRYLFAGVENFYLYDFYMANGQVNEDVFAYSNRVGTERVLVLYHNKYAATAGWIRISAAFPVKTGGDGGRTLAQKSLGEGLGLHNDPGFFVMFRDHVTGQEYIRNSAECFEKGLYAELGAYKYHVFMEFREEQDNEWQQLAHLAAYLNGLGVPSISEALREIFLEPVQTPFKAIVNEDLIRRGATLAEAPDPMLEQMLEGEIRQKQRALFQAVREMAEGHGDVGKETESAVTEFRQLLELARSVKGEELEEEPEPDVEYLQAHLRREPYIVETLVCWWAVHALGKMSDEAGYPEQSAGWLDDWQLGTIIASAFRDLGLDEGAARRRVALVKLLTRHQSWYEMAGQAHSYRALEAWLRDAEVQQFLQVNRYKGILWFNQESFQELVRWMALIAAFQVQEFEPGTGKTADAASSTQEERARPVVKEQQTPRTEETATPPAGTAASRKATATPTETKPLPLRDVYEIAVKLETAAEISGYQIEKLLELASR